MDETFEIQTIGRIRRMPEAKHYNSDLLDSCYLYTFDSKFTAGVKSSLGKNALEAKTLFLKNEHKILLLQRTKNHDNWFERSKKALRSIVLYLKQEYGLTNNKSENKTRLEAKGFIFSDNIIRTTLSGNVSTLNELTETDNLNDISVSEPINTHIHGREYHNRVGRIGLEIGLEYSYMNTILGKLFAEKFEYHDKLLSLATRQLYAFVINNLDLLRHVVREAMAVVLSQLSLDIQRVSKRI